PSTSPAIRPPAFPPAGPPTGSPSDCKSSGGAGRTRSCCAPAPPSKRSSPGPTGDRRYLLPSREVEELRSREETAARQDWDCLAVVCVSRSTAQWRALLAAVPHDVGVDDAPSALANVTVTRTSGASPALRSSRCPPPVGAAKGTTEPG